MANYSDVRFANINYEIYAAGNRFLGNGEVSLPELEFMSVDMSGAGLAGKFSAPIKGFVDSAELEITWHTINDDLNFFTVPSAKDLINGKLRQFKRQPEGGTSQNFYTRLQ